MRQKKFQLNARLGSYQIKHINQINLEICRNLSFPFFEKLTMDKKCFKSIILVVQKITLVCNVEINNSKFGEGK